MNISKNGLAISLISLVLAGCGAGSATTPTPTPAPWYVGGRLDVIKTYELLTK
ncbi:MAG: hypothetical protein ABL906_07310 [Sideroxydans sp.]